MHGCLAGFNEAESHVQTANPCSNHGIYVPLEHGFWRKSVNVIGHYDVMSLFSIETKIADTREIPQFLDSF